MMAENINNSNEKMKRIDIEKIVINIGVGKSGDPFERAKMALEELTGQKPSPRGAKKSVRDFGIHKGEPIGAMVTLRSQILLKEVLLIIMGTFLLELKNI